MTYVYDREARSLGIKILQAAGAVPGSRVKNRLEDPWYIYVSKAEMKSYGGTEARLVFHNIDKTALEKAFALFPFTEHDGLDWYYD